MESLRGRVASMEEALRLARGDAARARAAAEAAEEQARLTGESARSELEEAARGRDTLEMALAAAGGRADEAGETLRKATEEWTDKLRIQTSALEDLRNQNAALHEQVERLDALAQTREDAIRESESLRLRLDEQEQLLAGWHEQERLLRRQLEAASAAAADAAMLRRQLEAAKAGEEVARTLRQQLDEHRAALTEARSTNHSLIERIEEMARAFEEQSSPGRSRARRRTTVALALVSVFAVGFALWRILPVVLPQVEEVRKNAEALDTLKTQSTALAAELNTTLSRLQSAKESEISIERIRELSERLRVAESALKDFEREAPANLARMTKLQSDLDLARSRLERLSAELMARDFKILELERLLGEAASATMEIPSPGPLTLDPSDLLYNLPRIPDPVPAPPQPAGDIADDAMRAMHRQAEDAYKGKNFALAEVLYERIAEADPENTMAFSNLAAVQLELGKLVLAKANILKALEIQPDDAFARTTLGMILIRMGQADEAVAALLRAVELDPASADAFNYLGVAFDQKGERKRAIEEMEKAVNLAPGHAEAHFNLAVLMSHGDASEKEAARSHYEKALALGAEPDNGLERALQ
jgi:tetratricopeptide (TPR) repeat protein